jgi:hypothetical protein
MVGILIAAGITTLIVLPIVYLLWRGSKTSFITLLPLFLQLPMSLILNLTIKNWLSLGILGLGLPLLLTLLLLLLVAPFTEEAIKLAGLPLIFYSPFNTPHDAEVEPKLGWKQLRTAGAMSGIGFGVGEIWAIAWLIFLTPELGAYPWFFYQPFIIERAETVFIHGFMCLIAFWGYPRWLPISYLLAVVIHASVNAPIILLDLSLITAVQVSLFITLCSVAAFFFIAITLTTPEKRKHRRSI